MLSARERGNSTTQKKLRGTNNFFRRLCGNKVTARKREQNRIFYGFVKLQLRSKIGCNALQSVYEVGNPKLKGLRSYPSCRTVALKSYRQIMCNGGLIGQRFLKYEKILLY